MLSKRPEPGASKTRLHTHLTAEQAAAVQAAFIADLADLLEAHAGYVAYAPATDEAAAYFAGQCPVDRLFSQAEGDLGDRLHGAFVELSARGHRPLLAVGSDLPGLCADDLERAVAALEDHDVVVGPATDGGYWLIGLNEPQPGLFQEMPWSTPALCEATLLAAERLGLRVGLLDVRSDVDTWEDLLGLAQGPMPVHTAAAVDSLLAPKD